MQALLASLSEKDPDRSLALAIDRDRLPGHVAIIMDGNGRWAQRRGLPRIAGHKAGVEPVRMAVETCAQMGIEVLTLYAFSVENWKRPRTEVDTLWRLLRVYIRREVPTLMKYNVRLKAIGRLDALPAHAKEELLDAVDQLSGNTGMVLNLAINYGGRTEVVDAVNCLIAEARVKGDLANLEITEQDIASRLYTAGLPDPDLLIRTSGEMRISNFLLWQIAYSEMHVTETLWPDFNRQSLFMAVLDFQKRERRFGGLNAVEERLAEAVPIG